MVERTAADVVGLVAAEEYVCAWSSERVSCWSLQSHRRWDFEVAGVREVFMQGTDVGVLLAQEILVIHMLPAVRDDRVEAFPAYTAGRAAQADVAAVLVGRGAPIVVGRSGEFTSLIYDGDERPYPDPALEGDLGQVRDASGSQVFGCALSTGGDVRCWRARPPGGTRSVGRPLELEVEASGVGRVASVHAVDSGRVCALDDAGWVWCWGVGQPGATATMEPPRRVELPARAVLLGVADTHSCAVLGDQSVWCWGVNEFGQLGDGTREDRAEAARVLAHPSPGRDRRRRTGFYGPAPIDAFAELP